MTNIELFDEYTARALAQLYDAFPRKVFLDARQLCGHGETDEFGRVLSPDGSPSLHFDVALATLEWLAETGYIRTGDRVQYGLPQATLTAQGLLVLKAAPDSLQPSREGIGDRIARLVKSGAIDAAKEAARAAVAAGVGLVVR